MCTVSYIPTKDGFILTSNRDESTGRSRSLPPQKFEHASQSLFYPKDTLAGGTWIVTSEKVYTLCLLNGAFVKHKHEPPYKKSRGILVLEFYNYPDLNTFITEYDFAGIEPFTLLVVYFLNGGKKLTELRWDGRTLYINKKHALESHIWSSGTLYEPAIAAQRENMFADFLAKNTSPEQDEIIGFHSQKDEKDPINSIVMNRSGLMRTVSTTSIHRTQNFIKMFYNDILVKKIYRFRIMQMNSTCDENI